MQNTDQNDPLPEPAATVARGFFGAGTGKGSLERAARRMWWGVLWAAGITPLIFLVRFGEVGPLGWGLTVFFVAYCIVAGVALYFLPRRTYHTPVPMRGDWKDRVGAFWLIACAFGPFLGWIAVSAFTLTDDSWRLLYGIRVFLAGMLPVLIMLPLFRYTRGKSARIAVPLLVGITALPVWSTWNPARDLLDGPDSGYLRHTEQTLL